MKLVPSKYFLSEYGCCILDIDTQGRISVTSALNDLQLRQCLLMSVSYSHNYVKNVLTFH